ncbi:hypothetical protein ABPG72_019913 [Tetrahymena utriculariae]
MDSNSLKIIQEFDSHLQKRNEIKQMLRNKGISMLNTPDQITDFGVADFLSKQNGFGNNENKGNAFYKAPECFILKEYDGYIQEYQIRGLNVQNKPSVAIQNLKNQGQANNSNQTNQLNQTIIQQNQQIQSLDGQVNKLLQELSKYQIENQKLNESNIQIKEKNLSLEKKLQEIIKGTQQENSQKFQPQQIKKNMNQQIQQIQPQQGVNAWKPQRRTIQTNCIQSIKF